jgi:hypothetical protein
VIFCPKIQCRHPPPEERITVSGAIPTKTPSSKDEARYTHIETKNNEFITAIMNIINLKCFLPDRFSK